MYLNVKNNLIATYLQTKASYEAWRAFSNKEIPPILIYQMGKVGSSTVYNSLVNRSLPNSILHIHFLSDALPEYKIAHERAGVFPAPYHMFLGDAMRKVLKKKQDFPVKIISLVRDPVAIVVSALFENTHFHKELLTAGKDNVDLKKTIDYFNRYLGDTNYFAYVYEWFDKELKDVFGIDVFATPFPKERGYARYDNKNISALVIRLEDLSNKGAKAISDFLCLDGPLELQETNVRATTKHANEYREVLQGICISPEVCKEIYSSRFAKHFYSDCMIVKFMEQWSKEQDRVCSIS